MLSGDMIKAMMYIFNILCGSKVIRRYVFYMFLLGKLCRKNIYNYIRGVVVETIFGIYMHISSQYSTILFIFPLVYFGGGLLKND